MENTVQNKPAQATRITQGFSANPQVYLNSDRGSITHRLGADLKIEMPINLYKKNSWTSFRKERISSSARNHSSQHLRLSCWTRNLSG